MSVETMDYIAAARRFLRAAGRRVADADEPELRALADLRAVLDEALQAGVDGQRANAGRSWAAIGAALGTSKQAAYERFGPKREATPARPDASLPPPLDFA